MTNDRSDTQQPVVHGRQKLIEEERNQLADMLAFLVVRAFRRKAITSNVSLDDEQSPDHAGGSEKLH